jgi:selenocysteine lyase/cysteine desulfurase
MGGVNHESCAALCALPEYLEAVASSYRELCSSSGAAGDAVAACSSTGSSSYGKLSRTTVEDAYKAMAAMEQPLQQMLLQHLISVPGVTVVGPSDCRSRAPTISFVHTDMPSPVIFKALQAKGLAVHHGHMYAQAHQGAAAAWWCSSRGGGCAHLHAALQHPRMKWSILLLHSRMSCTRCIASIRQMSLLGQLCMAVS